MQSADNGGGGGGSSIIEIRLRKAEKRGLSRLPTYLKICVLNLFRLLKDLKVLSSEMDLAECGIT
jgi:hypothetical protein